MEERKVLRELEVEVLVTKEFVGRLTEKQQRVAELVKRWRATKDSSSCRGRCQLQFAGHGNAPEQVAAVGRNQAMPRHCSGPYHRIIGSIRQVEEILVVGNRIRVR